MLKTHVNHINTIFSIKNGHNNLSSLHHWILQSVIANIFPAEKNQKQNKRNNTDFGMVLLVLMETVTVPVGLYW